MLGNPTKWDNNFPLKRAGPPMQTPRLIRTAYTARHKSYRFPSPIALPRPEPKTTKKAHKPLRRIYVTMAKDPAYMWCLAPDSPDFTLSSVKREKKGRMSAWAREAEREGEKNYKAAHV